ncbi:Kelch repeat-containing protein [Marinoscillum furvescens]|uniref:N-acetylneuraminic acid mutarotase n=1 Tax=Marinoscillum furvescens DSM 4134 TaxID=1122208 RepID=A0A3D9KX77_MARFU|nr:galactose oxidase [Marinoscillum furvescens]RED92205.1 N-acetylneuraminic acid mutarotase [Marinoscillum furvescens DSM 4134]
METTKLKLWGVVFLAALMGCSDIDDETEVGNWVKYSDFEGVTRSGAVSFTIGDYAYVGLGTDGDDYLMDFWRYDATQNFWQEMAAFPGPGRIAAVSFSIDGKGYVGTGFNEDLTEEELGDFWEYDPSTNSWSEKAAFGGGARYAATGFTVDQRGYIGTGYDGNYRKDFWSYDPSADEWTQVVSLYGSKRESAVSFVIEGKAYVGAGRNNGSYLYDFWAFDPATEGWEDHTLYDDSDYFDEFLAAVSRYGAVAFTMDGKGYIVGGVASSYSQDVYAYEPNTGEWSQSNSFEGSARSSAVAFTIQNTGYVGTGKNSTHEFDDFWGFYPDEEYDEYD